MKNFKILIKIFISDIFLCSSMILATFTLFTIKYASTSITILVTILSLMVIVSGLLIAVLLGKENSDNLKEGKDEDEKY